MSISREEVERIAKLARLSFSDEEKQKLQQELSSILDYVDQLKQVQEKAEPAQPEPDGINLMRDDVAEPREAEEFLAQAPARSGNVVKVKSILE